MLNIDYIIIFILGFGFGVWFEYFNCVFWKNYAKKKYSTLNEVED